jgi:hypothetical protein
MCVCTRPPGHLSACKLPYAPGISCRADSPMLCAKGSLRVLYALFRLRLSEASYVCLYVFMHACMYIY